MTPRCKTDIQTRPGQVFGAPEELFGAILRLSAPASAFVTVITVPWTRFQRVHGC